MFECKVCAEKDLRIADLKAHIEALSPTRNDYKIPLVSIEADQCLSGSNEIIEISNEEVEQMSPADQAILSERDRLLSGNYS